MPYNKKIYGNIIFKINFSGTANGTGATSFMHITLFSFGYKHDPAEADTILDMRFLPNPFYIPELREGTGLEKRISEYVLDNSIARDFFSLFGPLLLVYLEKHLQAGRTHLQIAVGCTGGRHRSVAVAEYLRDLLNNSSYELTVFHRDIEKK